MRAAGVEQWDEVYPDRGSRVRGRALEVSRAPGSRTPPDGVPILGRARRSARFDALR